MNFNITKFAQEVHALAVKKGWWTPAPDFATFIALCHAELSEALEEYRNGRPMVYYHYCLRDDSSACALGKECKRWMDGSCLNAVRPEKPQGIAVELADCVIRMLDWCAAQKLDVSDMHKPNTWMEPNPCVGSLPRTVAICHGILANAYDCEDYGDDVLPGIVAEYLIDCADFIRHWLEAQDIDLWEIARLKHEYNKTRSYRHGNKKC